MASLTYFFQLGPPPNASVSANIRQSGFKAWAPKEHSRPQTATQNDKYRGLFAAHLWIVKSTELASPELQEHPSRLHHSAEIVQRRDSEESLGSFTASWKQHPRATRSALILSKEEASTSLLSSSSPHPFKVPLQYGYQDPSLGAFGWHAHPKHPAHQLCVPVSHL